LIFTFPSHLGESAQKSRMTASVSYNRRGLRVVKPPTLDDRSSVDVRCSRVCESGDRQRNGGGGG
jgi:hypothetical protein